MKFVFFGTPEFASIILEKLIKANLIPMAVVTNPDRPVGRKKILTTPAVKIGIRNWELGIGNNIEILQPEKLDSDFINQLKKYNAEIGILAAYGKIIQKEIINTFPKGIIVVHPSLLPKYRGATPVQSALLAGETETGTTLILMDEKVDHGAILANNKWQIAINDNYETLTKKLAELSGDLLVETLPKYLSGEIEPVPQNHSLATYTKKFTNEDGLIEESSLQSAENGEVISTTKNIYNKIRALNPEPGIWTLKDGRRMKLLEADLIDRKLVLKKIQFEGKKPKTIN